MAKGFKTGGRKAGQPNKITIELRSLLTEIVKDELQKLPELLNKLEPKDRAAMLEKFTGYVLPKMQIEEAKDVTEPIVIRIAENL